MHSPRKLALPSRFCEPTQPFDPSTPPEHREYTDIAQEWQELMGGIDLSDYDLDETITLWEFNDDNGDADVGLRKYTMGHKCQFVLGKIYYVLTINMPWMCVAAPWISKLLVQKCFPREREKYLVQSQNK